MRGGQPFLKGDASMNVTVIYKWGRDPDEILVYDDGSYKLRRDRLAANDDDVAAIVSARQLAKGTGGELTAATIGSGDTSWAMARGASRGVVAPELMPSIDNAVTALELEQAVKAAGDAPVVVMGDAQDAAGVAGCLAARLGMPLVAGVMDFAVDPDDEAKLLAHRRNGKTVETIRISTPALITVAATENEKGAPTMKEMLAAKRAPLEKVEGAAIPETTVEVTGHRCPPIHRARIFDGSPAEAADQLIAALKADGVLE